MASISNLNSLIAAAKNSGVVTWDGDLEDILTEISTLIKDRGLLSKTSSTQLVGLSSSEGYFAVVKDSGLWQYTYSASTPTAPHVAADSTDYYWVMIANFDEVPLSLAGLTDVNISSANIGQAVIFNDNNNKWENGDLAPVQIVDPLNGQTLMYSESDSKFINKGLNIIESSVATGIQLTEDDDLLLITDDTLVYDVELPITPYDGKVIGVAYSVSPVGGGKVNVNVNGVSIFTIDGLGGVSYDESQYAATFQYSNALGSYVIISAR